MPAPKHQHVYPSLPPNRGLSLGSWCLLGLLFVSAFLLVYVKDLHRRLLRDYQHLQQQSIALETEWEKLLLERSAWMSQARISQVAKDKLAMHLPSQKEMQTWDMSSEPRQGEEP